MRILVGIPKKMHSEICNLEIIAFRNAGAEIFTSIFGNSGEVTGLLKIIFLVIKNACLITLKSLKYNCEIIYLNTAFDNKTIMRDTITVFLIKLFKRHSRVVLKIHGSEAHCVLSKSLIKKYLFNKIDLFLVLSNEERNNFLRSGINPAKIEITANAISKNLYVEDKNFKKNLGLSNDYKVLLFIGRFIKEKGILDLIKSCILIKENDLKIQLLCIGDGPVKIQAQQLIDSFQLDGLVKLLGYLEEEEAKYYYSNCDILVLPTYHAEGFPMAVFQAVAAGKSIITTKIRASADYLEEYKNCLWVKEKNSDDIYNKIEILSSSLTLRNEIGRNNLELANKFTAKVICDNTFKSFARLLL